MSVVEALYIFDDHNTLLLEHVYRSRPPPAKVVLPLYLAHPSPRPSLIYLPNTNPSTLLYSIIQDQLLFLSPCSTDTEPLQVLEFLHRVADALEDFLGSPLLASKIESSYDVVAQLLGEMCDGGLIACTEPNALRDVVDAPSWMNKLLGGVGLPSSTPSSLAPSNNTPFNLSSRPALSRPNSNNASPVPWRRANVRHTSNELYVDIVETLHVILAPSGRPLSALAHGTIAFTAKVSGVPDLILQISCPGGIASTVSLPVFHPCVRLARWRERPGDFSFVPPDGRFVLAGYEVDLLGGDYLSAFSKDSKASSISNLNIPARAAVSTSLGPQGADFEVKLTLSPRFRNPSASPSGSSSSFPRAAGLGGRAGPSFGSAAGTTAQPTIDEVVVHVPLPAGVRNVTDLRPSRGDAVYAPGDTAIEWKLNQKVVATLMAMSHGGSVGATATLRGTVVGASEENELDGDGIGFSSGGAYDYDEGPVSSYQAAEPEKPRDEGTTEQKNARKVKQNKVLMPSCATVSFSVKGWLPSGIKVESLSVDQKKSKGLGAGVQPYKGVKYLCVSKRGIESRC